MSILQKLNYPIFIGDQSLSQFSSWLESKEYTQIILLVDENTLRFCVPDLLANVPALEGVEFLEVEQGEAQKNIEVVNQLWLTLSEMSVDRKSAIINVGGGVIGDLGGFVAATFKRGIDFIQVPTTLLAMVDASVGGKVGIDIGELKNQVGCFAEPAAVVVNNLFLDNLDVSQVKSGYAEMIKHGLIADPIYLEELKSFNLHVSSSQILRSIEIKAEVVAQDFKEQNLRKILNFGHTFGHAFESLYLGTQNEILHGNAVAAGIICEVIASVMLLNLDKKVAFEVCDFIQLHYGKLPLKEEDKKTIYALMLHDKKNVGTSIKMVGLSNIGIPKIDVEVSEKMVYEVIDSYINMG